VTAEDADGLTSDAQLTYTDGRYDGRASDDGGAAG